MNNIKIETKCKEDILTFLTISLAVRAAEYMELYKLESCWACCGESIAFASRWDLHHDPRVTVGSRSQFRGHGFSSEDGKFGTAYTEVFDFINDNKLPDSLADDLEKCINFKPWHINWITRAGNDIGAWEPDNTRIYTGESLNDACFALEQSNFGGEL
jgi:hypothetical protein